jgi:hypothetical protein
MSFLDEMQELREQNTDKYKEKCIDMIKKRIRDKVFFNPCDESMDIRYDDHFRENMRVIVRDYLTNEGFTVSRLLGIVGQDTGIIVSFPKKL